MKLVVSNFVLAAYLTDHDTILPFGSISSSTARVT